jgi:predicted flap endonuclease-1-like 5' DNA nuclease
MGFFLRKSWLWWLLAALLAWFITWLVCRLRRHGDEDAVAVNHDELHEARGLVATHKAKLDELTKARAGDKDQLTKLEARVKDLNGQVDKHKSRVAELEAGAGAMAAVTADRDSHRTRVAELEGEARTLTTDRDTHKARVDDLEAELARRPQPAPALDLAAAGAAIGSQVKMDDLEVVEGIGPKIAELLHRASINTWAQLARTEPARLRTILDDGGPTYRIADPASWPHQAALLANGRWSEFKTLTDELIAGRYVSGGVVAGDSGSGGSAGGGGGASDGATSLAAKPVPSAEQLRAGSDIVGTRVTLDDLKVVEGIGPAIEQLLHDGGVRTWRVLEVTPVDRLREILQAAGSRFQIHDPGTWPRQAGLLAEAKWAEFKTLTDELKGGRQV